MFFRFSKPMAKPNTPVITEFHPKPLEAVAEQDMRFIAPYLPTEQEAQLWNKLHDDQKAPVIKRVMDIAYIIEVMAVSPEQQTAGISAIAYLHYRCEGSDWYIIERDSDNDMVIGYFIAKDKCIFCSISTKQLLHHNVELDLEFKPCTIAGIPGFYHSGVNRFITIREPDLQLA